MCMYILSAYLLSHVWLFVTLWTVTPQALLSCDSLSKNTGVVAFPIPGDFPDPGVKPRSPELWLDSLATRQAPMSLQ